MVYSIYFIPQFVRCYLTPSDLAVHSFHLDLGRIAFWASETRAEIVGSGTNNDLEMFWDLILSTHLNCLIVLLIYFKDGKSKGKTLFGKKIFKSPPDRTHIITHRAIFFKICPLHNSISRQNIIKLKVVN